MTARNAWLGVLQQALATALCKTRSLRADSFRVRPPNVTQIVSKSPTIAIPPRICPGARAETACAKRPPSNIRPPCPRRMQGLYAGTLSFSPNDNCGAREPTSITPTPWRWRTSWLGAVLGCAMGGRQATAPAMAASIRYRASTNNVATSNAVKLTAIGICVGFSFVVASSSRGARRP